MKAEFETESVLPKLKARDRDRAAGRGRLERETCLVWRREENRVGPRV